MKGLSLTNIQKLNKFTKIPRMKNNNLIAEKSFDFAVVAVDIYKVLRFEQKEFVLSTQFLRSSTSVAANVEEAIGAQSKRDFLHKISIAYKEARETRLWIRLIKHANFIDTSKADQLLNGAEELQNIRQNSIDHKRKTVILIQKYTSLIPSFPLSQNS